VIEAMKSVKITNLQWQLKRLLKVWVVELSTENHLVYTEME
jgi:hypothetical protein